ncbi:MAG: hypothetical protein M0C28_00345 [Candidatus Moduliflexus flocculans]|nr:hypothetical protein [Candidatus Moduliflexus flocculans]
MSLISAASRTMVWTRGSLYGLYERHPELLRPEHMAGALGEIDEREQPAEAERIEKEMIVVAGDRFRHRDGERQGGAEKRVAQKVGSRKFPFRPELDRVVARAFDPDDVAPALPGQPDHDGSRPPGLPVDGDGKRRREPR